MKTRGTKSHWSHSPNPIPVIYTKMAAMRTPSHVIPGRHDFIAIPFIVSFHCEVGKIAFKNRNILFF